MEFLNIDSYMESVFKDSTEPILSYSKNNEPRIDLLDFETRLNLKCEKSLISF